MASVLVVSADPNALSQLEEIGSPGNIRMRTVSSAITAREWLDMHPYNLLLVDSRYAEEVPMELLRYGWKQNTLMVGGLFNLDGSVDDEWVARLSGARVYGGERALESIETTLQTIADVLTENEDLSIMLVEDLDSPRDIVCSYIEALGYPRVLGMRSAEEALSTLRENPSQYFCVVTDINMPDVDGLEFVRRVRKDELLHHLPVVMLTAHATAENLVECIRIGATGFLVKPPRKRLLRAELDKAKRLYMTKQSPRLCQPEEAHLLEDALSRTLGP